jgi:hypothetical protein
VRDVTTKPTKFTDGSGEFLAQMAILLLAMLIVWGVLSALGVEANGNRVRRITYSILFLIVIAASAIRGLKKLAAIILPVASASGGQAPAPPGPHGARPAASAMAPQVDTTNPAAGAMPRDRHRESGQWWLAHAGQLNGPYATAAVLADARTGRFTPDAQICQVGGEHWVLISVWLKERAASGAV